MRCFQTTDVYFGVVFSVNKLNFCGLDSYSMYVATKEFETMDSAIQSLVTLLKVNSKVDAFNHCSK